MTSESPEEPRSNSMLPWMLSIIALGGILLFLIVVSGGFFLYVFAGVGGLLFVGLMHYLLWGASLHQQTEGDREEERLREETEEKIW